MALTKAKVREILSTAGVDAEKMSDAVNAIIDGHVTSIEALREENASLKKDAEKLPELQKELETLKTAEKERGDKDYDTLKAEFDQYKADVQAKETRAAKETALKDVLKDLNLSDNGVAKVLKYHDIDSIEIEDGKIKGVADLRKSLKEEWGDYIKTEGTKGVQTPNPPTGGGKGYKDKAEIMAITDTAERQKAIAENINLFTRKEN